VRLRRFSIRSMMIGVAILALVAVVLERRHRFQTLAAYHRKMLARFPLIIEFSRGYSGVSTRRANPDRFNWHANLVQTYESAALHPWMPLDSVSLRPRTERHKAAR
jgi:hypothetical protein